jgi:hypothetical protein
MQWNHFVYQIMNELIPYEHIARLCAIHGEAHFNVRNKEKLFKNFYRFMSPGTSSII